MNAQAPVPPIQGNSIPSIYRFKNKGIQNVTKAQTLPNGPTTAQNPSEGSLAPSKSAPGPPDGLSALGKPLQTLQRTPDDQKLIANDRQRTNPLIPYIKNVKYEFLPNISADFLLGADASALFLSLKFHLLNPLYLPERVKGLDRRLKLHVLVCLVDVTDSTEAVKNLNKYCIDQDLSLILTWSNREAARYIETFKALSNSNAGIIKGPEKGDTFTQVSGVNEFLLLF
uniref:ERCC1-like central domain-containing protein n=1 Tax=Arcella intermedia TaxID=1963864 RepID=A0A6B2LF56_9EUKA